MYIMRMKDKKKQFSFGILSLKQIDFFSPSHIERKKGGKTKPTNIKATHIYKNHMTASCQWLKYIQ